MVPQGRQVVLINATAATAAATITSNPLDTISGADGSKSAFATIDVIATTQDTTGHIPTVLKLQESDTTVATTFTDIVAFVGGTATSASVGWVIPAGTTSTSTPNAWKFNVDLRGRKRYLQVVVSPATTQTFTAIANTFRNGQSPSTAAKANVLALIEG